MFYSKYLSILVMLIFNIPVKISQCYDMLTINT